MQKLSQYLITTIIFLVFIIFSYIFLDIPTINYFYQFKGTFMYNFAKNITDYAKAEYQLIPALIFYLYFRKRNRYYANLAFLIFLSVAISGLITDLFKFILGRYRPIEYFEYGNFGFQFFQTRGRFTSIPSGHTTTFFSAIYILSLFFKKYRFIFLTIGFLMVSTRIITLNHYPSDVIAGIYVAITVSSILYNHFKKRRLFEQNGKSTQI